MNEELFEIKKLKEKAIRKIILEWGAKNYKDFSWRKTDNKWHALLAEMLLQRTRVRAVVGKTWL